MVAAVQTQGDMLDWHRMRTPLPLGAGGMPRALQSPAVAGADPTQFDLFPRGVPVAEGEAPARPEPSSRAALGSAEPVSVEAGDVFPRLDHLLGGRLAELVLTSNRRRILSARPAPRRPGSFAVRLDASFAAAPEEVIRAVALWIAADGGPRRRALAVIRRYFETSCEAAEEGPPARRRRPVGLQPLGCRLDLRQVRDELNRVFFDGRLHVGVTWGRAPSRRRGRGRSGKRTVRLGSYCWESNVIRVHRALDHASVPHYVVASVVYHEMLHAALPPPAPGSRRRLHPPEFRRLEARFPDHERAQRWIGRHLGALLRQR
jgi:hypothetical protein